MIVRMGWLQKPQDWSLERFREHWRGHHGDLARQLPGLRAYVQNHIVDHVQRGIAFQRGPMTLDGFSQLWFADTAALDAAFASPAGQAAMAHANTFIEEITTFLVEPFVVVDREGELR